MDHIDRTPLERTSILRDRIAHMLRYCAEKNIDIIEANCMTSDMFKILEGVMADVKDAFAAAEKRGEARGRIAGGALAKLTDEERKALGVVVF